MATVRGLRLYRAVGSGHGNLACDTIRYTGPTSDPEPLRKRHKHCREGLLHAVEGWIRGALQLSEDTETPGARWSTALEIALERGDHSLTHLLLCNGYDPDPEPASPDLTCYSRTQLSCAQEYTCVYMRLPEDSCV